MLKQITPDNFYTSKSPSSALTYSFPFVILCSLAVYTFTVIVFLYVLLFEYFELLNIELFYEILKSTLQVQLGLGDSEFALSKWYSSLDRTNQIVVMTSMISAQIFALFLAIYSGLWAKKKTLNLGERQISGTKYLEFAQAESKLTELLESEYKFSGYGLPIHHNLNLPKGREGQHVLVCGQIGSGKTSILLPIVTSVIEDKEKSVIYDIKGDFSAYYRHHEHVKVLAAFDQNSIQWAICKDVYDYNSAMQFAEAMIPENSKQDPLWVQSSRIILVGICQVLIQKHGSNKWGWKDLSEMLKLPEKYLHRELISISPEAGLLVDEKSKTSKSMVLTLQSYTAPIHQIALAWENAENGISLNEWVSDQNSKIRTIIVQQNPRYKALSEVVCNLALCFISNQLLSLEDDTERKFYFILDEIFHLNFPIIDFMTVSRSKGARMLIGVQDLALLTRKMTKEEVMSLASMVGTTIMLRVGSMGDTIKTMAESLGSQEIERLQSNFDKEGKATFSWQRVTIPVVRKEDLLSLPQPSKQGIHGYLSIAGTGIVGKLCWKLPNMTKLSKPFELADWIKKSDKDNKEDCYADDY
ncbi:MAG: hypothetical protein CMK65_13215 [Pseudoalteromonas sp.]|uniref:type IV secretion system DNA-binding domain-containing protein n=1 Tax=Pseudoalteromonas sp. TaxID=53249 RepID=UPI000C93D028|nr:type IV secretion system DNA-binding domain-containing protein [Pseudoalteromonas sp.]MAD04564.1 hypothetical protein [Pseudoalteromonas sp.]|tara:strand:- start:31036 stop:32787 length:1752 start_codon:yes stop_codon:yes gene_type:complete